MATLEKEEAQGFVVGFALPVLQAPRVSKRHLQQLKGSRNST